MKIFQTWKTKDVPDFLQKFVESWKIFNPTFDYQLYTDDDNDEFMKTNFPDYYPMFKGYSRGIQRADVIRYFRLYRDGGIYADLDFECLKSFESYLIGKENLVILGLEPKEHCSKTEKMLVCNALMISPPGHPFWLTVFEQLKICQGSSGITGVLSSTGPRMLTQAVEKYKGTDVLITPSILFYPLVDASSITVGTESLRKMHMKMAIDHRFPDISMAVHYWSGTWTIAIDKVKKDLIKEYTHQGGSGTLTRLYIYALNNYSTIIFIIGFIVFILILIFVLWKTHH